MYRIFIAQNTKKKFLKLPPLEQEKLRKQILLLKDFPSTKNIKKLTEKAPFWRLKFSKYRIIFAVEKESREIKITHLRKRNEKTYRNL